MKFVCPGCSQKHHIADELVRGDGVRVRCRNCGRRVALRVKRSRPDSGVGAGKSVDLSRGSNSVLFSWNKVGAQPLSRLVALAPYRPARPTPPPPPPARARRASPPPLPPSHTSAPEPEPLFNPELLAEPAQPVGVTSGILDMLEMAESYFAPEPMAPIAAAACEPGFPTFITNDEDRTLQIVLPPPLPLPRPARQRWHYVGAALAGAALAATATLALVMGWNGKDVVVAPSLAAGKHMAVGAQLSLPPVSSEQATVVAEWQPPSPHPNPDVDVTVTPTPTTPRPAVMSRRPVRHISPTVTVRQPEQPATRPRVKQHVVWDEVECLLADNPPKVCAPFLAKHKRKLATETPAEVEVASNNRALTRNLINAGIAKVRWRVDQCGTRGWGAGHVTVSLQVNASGVVTDATVASAPNSRLASCVVENVKRAQFAPTRAGGRFSYLFSFR